MRRTTANTAALALALTFGLGALASAQDATAPTPPPQAGSDAGSAMPMMRGGGMTLFGMGRPGPGEVLTPEDRAARMAEHFAAADTNGDGLLSADEIAAALEAMRLERLAVMAGRQLQALDLDGDGALSLEELMAGPSERMFARADTDGDGVISPEEWDAAMAQMRQRVGDRMDRGRHGMDRRAERQGDGHGAHHRMGRQQDRRWMQRGQGG
jgi:hypothetical protein